MLNATSDWHHHAGGDDSSERNWIGTTSRIRSAQRSIRQSQRFLTALFRLDTISEPGRLSGVVPQLVPHLVREPRDPVPFVL